MTTPQTEYDFSVLGIRRRMGRREWSAPQVGPGPSGVTFTKIDGTRSVIISSFETEHNYEEVTWLHASISAHPDGAPVPAYEELTWLRSVVWGEHGWAFQVFAPPMHHVNIRVNALHIWGRLDGGIIHPNFGENGTI